VDRSDSATMALDAAVGVGLRSSGDGLGSGDFEVALAKRGERSMVPLREADRPRASPCPSDAALPWASQNVPCRPDAKDTQGRKAWA
jgi:hypothetical protein